MFSGLLLLTSLMALLSAVGNAAVTIQPSNTTCRCFPGEECWPSPAEWTQFNESIDGRLIQTIPLGKPCHNPSYKPGVCNSLREQWTEPEIHYESSSSIMAPWFTNGSCDPFHPIAKPCTLGNYIVYAVNVSQPSHISRALAFATAHNLRVVVRNTGHDYNGKSTGAGALGIWTHHLKDIDIVDHHDTHYSGKAIRLGAGVQGFEAWEAADAHGYQVVSGECPTVGIAGGYCQGGGHSALSSRYGLAADQVLKWEDTFYSAVGLYHSLLPTIVDAGAMSIWYFTNTTFYIAPLTGPNIPVQELISLLKPFREGLEEMGIRYTLYAEQFPTYLSEFNGMMPEIPVGEAQYGGWLIPRSVVRENNTALTAAYRQITEDGATFIGVGLNVSKALVGDVDNAVLPAWRDTLIDTTLTTPWQWDARQNMLVQQYKMTYEYLPLLERLAPDSGAYMNEGDFRQPNFQKAFYGVNYPRLRQIKKKYDPLDVFYGQTAVGSDEWTMYPDGRLCRVSSSADAEDYS
ncbi:FAD dependent oxidoreductase family protein [Aspergillus niger]|uniref:FAD dependent oxidoreductase family protein n=1 Tax=Aspergillus niger TaxID=5061 RepID=A0A505HT76_ASPNG|nr:FAD dependent oxidoreductase family protein [Aspergillus niger]